MPVGTHGIPPGWQGHKWGSPKYDFTVVQDGAGKALQLKSDNDSSSISKEIKVDVKQYPILEWKWKVVALPPRGNARKGETDDEAAQLYVTFPRFPSAVRSRIIGYIWDSTEPAGASFPSAKVGTVHFIVVRSGGADLGKWITETRNVLEDFKKIYGEAPGEPAGAITLSINSQNTALGPSPSSARSSSRSPDHFASPRAGAGGPRPERGASVSAGRLSRRIDPRP